MNTTDTPVSEHDQQSSTAKIKVAILGGGAAGVSAAFWLTATPELRAKYDVTIYTQGWRLGGKCASGRDPADHQRIEEHGLHMLMGCYEHAFQTIQACYSEWQPKDGSPFKQWTDAFTPQRQITLEEQDDDNHPNDWIPWNFKFPRLPGTPGDAPFDIVFAELSDLVIRFANLLENFLTGNFASFLDRHHHTACDLLRKAAAEPRREIIDEALTSFHFVKERIQPVEAKILSLAERLLPRSLRRDLILANLGWVVAVGLLMDVLPHGDQGFDLLNGQDFREWLSKHGATKEALDSAPIRALYNLTFAFPGGDSSNINNGSIDAGVTLRFALEALVGYKDAPLWKMNAGMGDTVFTPFYQVLNARRVNIKLFHRVTGLSLKDGAVAAIQLAQQAEFIGPDYKPFIVVNGLDCWAKEPDWSQLKNGDELRKQGVNFESDADNTAAGTVELKRGVDFDIAVLAVPPEVIKIIGSELSAQDPSWKSMITQSSSVVTGAFQLWLQPTLEQLGWELGPTVLTAFAEPFDSWADMSHLLKQEIWNLSKPPQSIGYFCGSIAVGQQGKPDPKKKANDWLEQNISALWPGAADRGKPIDPKLIVSSYFRLNTDRSELYVQTPAGNVASRLAPNRPYFTNLYIAGDWTLTRFSGGGVESGRVAAAAIREAR